MVITGNQMNYDAQQDKEAAASADIRVEFGNMYTKEIESFGESILMGKALEVPAEDAVQVQRIVEAAYESAKGAKFIFL